ASAAPPSFPTRRSSDLCRVGGRLPFRNRMTDAAPCLSPDDAPPSANARAVAPSSAGDPAARRGPFRPEVWLNARQRHASRLAAHYFRAFDVLAVAALTLLCADAATAGSLLRAELAAVAPFGVGALTVLGLMRSTGRYGFARGENPVVHLGLVAALVAIGTATALLAAAVLQGAQARWSAGLGWGGLVLIALVALHLGWSAVVRRWRRSGALTPNIVLVGATRRAETLIREALARRDLNVLGIFDDRLARSPRAVAGVPVLGVADDLLTHRMTPYVDQVVLAIDPRAEARVRELNARLRTLP